MPKTIRLNATLYSIMKIPNKRELQQKASDYSSNIDFKPTRQGDVVATSQRRLSIRHNDVARTSQMKHPTTSQWYVAKTSHWYVSTMS